MTVYVFLGITGAHTVQLYFWALAFWFADAITEFPTAIYFSLVTYTSLGYGDVVLEENFRIFGAMESITGLLMFGITTAFLVGYYSRIMREAPLK